MRTFACSAACLSSSSLSVTTSRVCVCLLMCELFCACAAASHRYIARRVTNTVVVVVEFRAYALDLKPPSASVAAATHTHHPKYTSLLASVCVYLYNTRHRVLCRHRRRQSCDKAPAQRQLPAAAADVSDGCAVIVVIPLVLISISITF